MPFPCSNNQIETHEYHKNQTKRRGSKINIRFKSKFVFSAMIMNSSCTFATAKTALSVRDCVF